MTPFIVAARIATLSLLVFAVAGAGTPDRPFFSAGFEDGLRAPWGTGQNLNNATTWWNSGGCGSTAEADWRVRRNGSYSLHVANPSSRAFAVYGTTQQPLKFVTGHRYHVEVWALGRELASKGAVCLVVDDAWKTRPIELPQGSYDWRKLSGDFTWTGGEGQCRILSEDRSEAWLDDITITDLGPVK